MYPAPLSQGLLSKAHDEPLYVLNHAYDGLRCGAPRGTVRVPDDSLFGKTIQPAPSHIEYTYHQLTPMSRRHHIIYTVEARGGAMLYKPVFLTGRTLYSSKRKGILRDIYARAGTNAKRCGGIKPH